METQNQVRRMIIQYLLDRYGRVCGKLCPFFLYRKLPNYERLQEERIEIGGYSQLHVNFYKMRSKLHQTGVEYANEAQFVTDSLFFQYCFLLSNYENYRFSLDEIEAMFIEAQTLSIKRYAKLRKKQETSLAKYGELRLTFSELYDLYGNQLVYFVHGYNGIGKSTWIEKQRAVLAGRKKIVLVDHEDSLRFAAIPLANLLVVDSGRFLPVSGEITRDQVVETIPLSVEKYKKYLREDSPIAIVDTGDNLGQRVTMLMMARDIRGKSCPIHLELLDASLLESVVRNENRERKEYCLEPEKVHEAYKVISQLATSCYKRDFRSPTYCQMYELLYIGKWCAWEEEPCRFNAHEPNEECRQFCKRCSRHCPHKIRFGSKQGMTLNKRFPQWPNYGVFL